MKSRKRQLYRTKSTSEKKSKTAKEQWELRLTGGNDGNESDPEFDLVIENDLEHTTSSSNHDKTRDSQPQNSDPSNTLETQNLPEQTFIEPYKEGTKRVYKHRALASFLPALPKNVVVSAILFVRCFDQVGNDEHLKQQFNSLSLPKGQLNYNQIYYLQTKLIKLIQSKKNITVKKEILRAWLSRLLSHKAIEGLFSDIELPDYLIPDSYKIS